MKEHPILFSTEMVQAILEGRKTQTRRVIKPQPKPELSYFGWEVPNYTHVAFGNNLRVESKHRNRYGQPGDFLWVRETWTKAVEGFLYKATPKPHQYTSKWKPSIHMPKAAARIWLQIEEVRVERVRDISEEDAKAEGIELNGKHSLVTHKPLYKNYDNDSETIGWMNPINSFETLWNSINGNWDANPWVWVVKFKELSRTGRPEPATSNQ